MPQVLHRSVLVTGARGFVGSHLCRALARGGWRVVAASREAQIMDATPRITPVTLSFVSDSAAWRLSLAGVDCVVHLAARVHQLTKARSDAVDFAAANVAAACFVAQQAAGAGVRRFIFLSSIKVNGDGGTPRPYRADDVPGPCDEYGRSKLAAETMLRELCGNTGMELVIIRPPLVYGPGVRANFERLLRLVALAWPLPLGSIRNRRSMLGMTNLVNFIEVCMTHPKAAQRTWLVSDGEDLSTPQLLEKLARLLNRPARLFPFPPSWLRQTALLTGFGEEAARLCDSLVVDNSAACGELGWQPRANVDEELARTVDAYRKARGT